MSKVSKKLINKVLKPVAVDMLFKCYVLVTESGVDCKPEEFIQAYDDIRKFIDAGNYKKEYQEFLVLFDKEKTK